jgi:hypothetical protein
LILLSFRINPDYQTRRIVMDVRESALVTHLKETSLDSFTLHRAFLAFLGRFFDASLFPRNCLYLYVLFAGVVSLLAPD